MFSAQKMLEGEMSITQISSRQLGKEAKCRLCQAGSTVSFNWQYAQKNNDVDLPKNKSIYVNPQPLKSGTLFECKICGSHWYLDSEEFFMNYVQESKLSLIYEWSSKNLYLSSEQKSTLKDIGRTPPDLYGNGSQFDETPCSVKTTSGEVFEFAIVSKQKHAPFEEWRNYRLASEIREITASKFVLPLEVRVATSQADEIRMSFAPTLVCLSNGQKVILNWTQNFLRKTGVKTSETTVCKERVNISSMPEIYSLNEKVAYFIADTDSEGASPSNKKINPTKKAVGFFSGLFNR